jgi:two-component system cell cycle sensor histidine kinase/response regulator CckA
MAQARLLLVEDEPALVDLLKKYLERLGYEVDTRADAEQALEQYGANPNHYALVLTDLTLPGMNGEQMIERMRESNPKIRAIISSGYPYQPRWKQVAYLQKPYMPKMLADMIEKMLRR